MGSLGGQLTSGQCFVETQQSKYFEERLAYLNKEEAVVQILLQVSR